MKHARTLFFVLMFLIAEARRVRALLAMGRAIESREKWRRRGALPPGDIFDYARALGIRPKVKR